MTESTFTAILEETRRSVAAELEAVQTAMLAVAENAPGPFPGYLKTLLERKGKRIRSTFLFLVARSNGPLPSPARAVGVSAAIEFIHLASLVHDDIIDDTDLRRNEKTAHKRWGNRVAILLGDYILAQAMELIWSDADHRLPLALCRASSRLIAGEVLETEQAGNVALTLSQYLAVIEGKTASLLEACGECAGILAGFDAERIAVCAGLGREFGIAFQMVDDLLDFGYGAADLDKRTFSDLRNGYFTLPLILFFEKAGPAEKSQMLELVRDVEDPEKRERILALLDGSDALLRSRKMAEAHIERCAALAARLPANPITDQLARFCAQMARRSL